MLGVIGHAGWILAIRLNRKESLTVRKSCISFWSRRFASYNVASTVHQ
jgi:hypothetical protein